MRFSIKNIINKFIKKKITISVAESCTGGSFSSEITSISGSSKVFKLGLVTYSNSSKSYVLKVPKKIIKKYGAVSKQVCLQMVNKITKIGNSNMGIAITGIAGPSGGNKEKPVGLVYIGIKKGNKVKIVKCLFKNQGRLRIKKAATNKAFGLILSFVK